MDNIVAVPISMCSEIDDAYSTFWRDGVEQIWDIMCQDLPCLLRYYADVKVAASERNDNNIVTILISLLLQFVNKIVK